MDPYKVNWICFIVIKPLNAKPPKMACLTILWGWSWKGLARNLEKHFWVTVILFINSDSPSKILHWLSHCSEIPTHCHLVGKQTLNPFAKLASLAQWLSVRLRTKWLWVWIPLQALKFQISCWMTQLLLR